jgi:hypothetical protein
MTIAIETLTTALSANGLCKFDWMLHHKPPFFRAPHLIETVWKIERDIYGKFQENILSGLSCLWRS